MEYDDGAPIDPSEVVDDRGGDHHDGAELGWGAGAAGAGALVSFADLLPFNRKGPLRRRVIRAVIGIVVIVGALGVWSFGGLGGNDEPRPGSVASGFGDPGGPGQAGTVDLAKQCRTGADANTTFDCAIVANVNSIQAYWSNGGYARLAPTMPGARSRYSEADTVFFRGAMNTACGGASTDQGPFYCSGDKRVYIDLSFYDQLRTQFGTRGGPLVNAYVLAHEYGHHVQDLLGTQALVRTTEGPTSGSVRFELQADCYAGVWMNHASQPAGDEPPLITGITRSDLAGTVDAAGHLGDDVIQRRLQGGTVDPDTFTHGTARQRMTWLVTGFTTGDATRCNTFADVDLG